MCVCVCVRVCVCVCVQGRRRRGGWGSYGHPSFSLLSASAHARIIPPGCPSEVCGIRIAIEPLCPSVVAKVTNTPSQGS